MKHGRRLTPLVMVLVAVAIVGMVAGLALTSNMWFVQQQVDPHATITMSGPSTTTSVKAGDQKDYSLVLNVANGPITNTTVHFKLWLFSATQTIAPSAVISASVQWQATSPVPLTFTVVGDFIVADYAVAGTLASGDYNMVLSIVYEQVTAPTYYQVSADVTSDTA